MKKIFGLIAALILVMGCDDGEMSFNTFNFSNGNPASCGNSNLYYKINGSEVLIIDLSGSPLINVPTEDGVPRLVTIGSTNTITYRNYDGTPTSASICNFPAPASPGVIEEWSGEGTLSIETDIVENSNGIITGYSHKITLLDISFSRDGKTTRIVDNEFGSVVVPISFTFNFGVEEADLQLKTCTENDLIFKRKAREALILNIDPDVFSDNVAGSTDTINITDLEDEGVIFLVYDGSITDTHICSVIAPITPNITERWEATAGTITINTVAASGNTGVNHEITFTNMVFTKVSDTSGQTFAISDLIVPEPGETGYYFGLYVP